jgi:hypothetical protein
MSKELAKWRERDEPNILAAMANPHNLDAIQFGFCLNFAFFINFFW